MTPHLDYENQLWQQGKTFVAGVDEVGRGAFAGPIVAAAVVFPINLQQNIFAGLKDSKALTANKREFFVPLIQQHALHYQITDIPVRTINQIGILKANFKAMRKAVTELTNCDHVLVDGYAIPKLDRLAKHQTHIIKGDTISISIAAASILAKVYRDELMADLHNDFPHYHWHQNKGYGTKKHRDALLQHGPTRHHRKLFIKKTIGA